MPHDSHILIFSITTDSQYFDTIAIIINIDTVIDIFAIFLYWLPQPLRFHAAELLNRQCYYYCWYMIFHYYYNIDTYFRRYYDIIFIHTWHYTLIIRQYFRRHIDYYYYFLLIDISFFIVIFHFCCRLLSLLQMPLFDIFFPRCFLSDYAIFFWCCHYAFITLSPQLIDAIFITPLMPLSLISLPHWPRFAEMLMSFSCRLLSHYYYFFRHSQ